MYRVQEFAALAGVTVRALHHYDRLGLLKPLRRVRTGYRIYRDSDFARLEQIVVLKFLGLPLRDIGPLLKKSSNLKETLGKQRHVLLERRRQLDAALAAIEKAERSLNSDEPDWKLFTAVVKEIEMRSDTAWTKKYYTEGGQAKVEARRAIWSPELQERVTQQWKDLIADVEAALARHEDPASPAAQSFVARWDDLLAQFTGRDPEIQHGLNRMWADRANWPEGKAKSFRLPTAVTEFVALARARQ